MEFTNTVTKRTPCHPTRIVYASAADQRPEHHHPHKLNTDSPPVDDPTRPYYMLADPDKLTTEDKFLYEDENLQYWVIGPVVGPTNGYWFSPRVSSNPAESTQWHVNTGTGFILQPRVKATAACKYACVRVACAPKSVLSPHFHSLTYPSFVANASPT